MSYLNQLFDAINDMANDFDDVPPNSVKAVVALSVLCQIDIDNLEAKKTLGEHKPLMQNPQEMAKALEPVMKVKANVVKKRRWKRKYCIYSGERLTGKQRKFASAAYARAYWKEHNRDKVNAYQRKWQRNKKKKDA
mgnify:CR=1 FL=1|jgi:hypothetical protein